MINLLDTQIINLVIAFIAGLLVGVSGFYFYYQTQNKKLKAYKRELEKSSVASSSSESKVDVLEAKIAVLEKALHDALKKNNS